MLETVVATVLGNAVVATLFAIGVVLLSRWCHKPALLHGLWVVVLLKLVTPPMITIPVPLAALGWETDVAENPAEEAVATKRPSQDPAPESAAAPPVEYSLPLADSPVVIEAPPISETEGEMFPEEEAARAEMTDSATGFASDIQKKVKPRESADSTQSQPFHEEIAAQETGFPATTPGGADQTALASGGFSWRDWGWVLLAVWGLGGIAVVLTAWRQILRFERSLRHAEPADAQLTAWVGRLADRAGLAKTPKIFLLEGCVSPMLWGFGRPRLIFPRGLLARLNDEATETLILHELAHMRRGDHWVRVLELICQCVYWWHPLIWWGRKQLRLAEEECCDAFVVEHCRGGVYAHALLATVDFLSDRKAAVLPPTASGIGHLEFLKRRLTMIMQGGVSSRLAGLPKFFLLTAAVVGLSILPRFVAKQAEAAFQVAAEAEKPLPEPASESDSETAPKQSPAPRIIGREPMEFEKTPKGYPLAQLHVRDLEFSPDGKYLAAGYGYWDSTGQIVVYDFAKKKVLKKFSVPRGVASSTFSPDGKYLATSYWNNHLIIHDTKTWDVVAERKLGTKITRLDFSPDGKYLSAAGEDGFLSLLPVGDWDKERPIEGDFFRFQKVAFSPDSKLLAAVGGSFSEARFGRGLVFEVETGKQIAKIESGGAVFGAVAFSPDGKELVTGEFGRNVNFWDPKTGKSLAKLNVPGTVRELSYSQDGRLAAACGDRTVYVIENHQIQRQLVGHEDEALSVAFTRDGNTLVTGSEDSTIRIWNSQTGVPQGILRPREVLEDTAEAVLAVAHSPDGRFVVTTHEDGSVRLRDAHDGTFLKLIEGHEDVVASVAFSPDSQTLATGSYDHGVKLFRVETGKLIHDLEGHTNWVFAVAFSPDGKTLASGGYDKSLRLWDVANGKPLGVLEGHSAAVRCLAFSPDRKQIASGSSDRTVRLWDRKTQKAIHELEGHEAAVRAVAFSPDGDRLASGSEDKTIRLWDPGTGKLEKELKGHTGMVWSLAYSPRGLTLASGGFDNTLRIWNAKTGASLQSLTGHNDVITSLSYAPDSRSLITGSYDKTLKRWTAIEPPIAALADLNLNGGSNASSVRFVAFTPNGKRMITGSLDRKIRLWDLETGRVIKQVLQPRPLNSGALDDQGKWLATTGYGGACFLFDADTLKLIKRFDDKTKDFRTVALSPDSQILAVGAWDGSITLWSWPTGEKLRELPKLNLPVEGLAFSPDGKLLVSGTGNYKESNTNGTVKLWDTQTWKVIADLPDTTKNLRPVQFSPHGKTLIAGGSQEELLVYDVASKKLVRRIRFNADLKSATFQPDSRHVVLGGWDGRVEMWNVETGVRVVRYAGHQPGTQNSRLIYSLAASVDGSVVASAGADGHVKLWPAISLPPVKPLLSAEKEDAEPFHVAMAPDGSRFVVAYSNKTIEIRDTKTGKVLNTIDGLNTSCSGVSFAPDGQTFASTMIGGNAFIWDAETGKELFSVTAHPGGARRCDFSPDGTMLATCGWDETAAVWNLPDGSLRYRTPKQGLAVSDVKFSPEGKLLIASTGSWREPGKPGVLKAWKADDGKFVKKIGDHKGEIKGFVFDAGAWHIVSFGSEGAKIWSRFYTKPPSTRIGQGMTITAAAVSPEGNTLYMGNVSGQVLAYHMRTGKITRTYAGHDKLVHGMHSSRDGSVVISSSNDGSVKLWPANQLPVPEKQFQMRDDPRESLSVAYSPDGKRIAVGGKDKTVSLLDARSKKVLRELTGHNGMVYRLVFSPDSKTLLTGSSDGTARLWNIETGEEIAKFTAHGDELSMVRSIAISTDGKRIAVGNENGETRVWNVETKRKLLQLPKQSLSVSGVVFSPDGKTIATSTGIWNKAQSNGELKLWDAQNGDAIASLVGHKKIIKGLIFNHDGSRLISYGSDKTIRFWDVATKTLMGTFHHDREIISAALSGDRLAFGDWRGGVNLMDVKQKRLVARTGGHFNIVGDMAFSPDGSELATASHDGYFKIWSTEVPELAIRRFPDRDADDAARLAEQIRDWQPLATGNATALQLEKVKVLNPHGDKIWFAIYSPDGKILATGGSDKTVKLWNAETMELLQTLSGHGSFTTHAAFSPDGKKVATVSWRSKGNLKLWDVQTGKLLATSDVHKETCRQVAFSPDGQFIATVSEDHFVRLFNPQLAMLLSMDAGLNAYSVAFSPDSQMIAVGTGNLGEKKEGHILLYDTQTGKKVKELENSDGYVFHLQFLKDGKRLLAANGGAGCVIWNTKTGEMEELYRTVEDTRWVEIDHDEKRLIASARVGEVFLWNRYISGPVVSLKASEKFIHCATFSPDGRHIVVADEAGALTLWQMTNAKQTQVAKSDDSAEE